MGQSGHEMSKVRRMEGAADASQGMRRPAIPALRTAAAFNTQTHERHGSTKNAGRASGGRGAAEVGEADTGGAV